MKNKKILLLLFLLVSFPFVACGKLQTEIIETSSVLNTDDEQGPYQVFASVIVDKSSSLAVQLVYSTDRWKTRTYVPMISQSQDVFRGEIKGQKAGTQIEYFVLVQDEDKVTITEPISAMPLLNSPSTIPFASVYHFKILSN